MKSRLFHPVSKCPVGCARRAVAGSEVARRGLLPALPGAGDASYDRFSVRWRSLAVGLLLVLVGWFPLTIHAHKPSDAYLTLHLVDNVIDGQIDLALRDLEYVFGLDADNDGNITWGELKARHSDISQYVAERFHLFTDGRLLTPTISEHLVANHVDGTYAVLRFQAVANRPPTVVEIHYKLFFDTDPMHRGLLSLIRDGVSQAAVFSPTQTSQHFELTPRSWFTQWMEFATEGVWHIWMGIDHILFLIALLLPAVLIRVLPGTQSALEVSPDLVLEMPEHHGLSVATLAATAPQLEPVAEVWAPVISFQPALLNVVKIVTAFTVAHSITLSLAALNFIQLPSRWVESCIAASVVIAALNNLRPFFRERAWLVAFGFGLIHGFGFASVLRDLGLPRATLATALVGFNLGVEIGQLVIVGIFLPITYRFRATRFYRQGILLGGSVVIAVIALGWLIDRAFQRPFMPF